MNAAHLETIKAGASPRGAVDASLHGDRNTSTSEGTKHIPTVQPHDVLCHKDWFGHSGNGAFVKLCAEIIKKHKNATVRSSDDDDENDDEHTIILDLDVIVEEILAELAACNGRLLGKTKRGPWKQLGNNLGKRWVKTQLRRSFELGE